jgi:hypothetical protein
MAAVTHMQALNACTACSCARMCLQAYAGARHTQGGYRHCPCRLKHVATVHGAHSTHGHHMCVYSGRSAPGQNMSCCVLDTIMLEILPVFESYIADRVSPEPPPVFTKRLRLSKSLAFHADHTSTCMQSPLTQRACGRCHHCQICAVACCPGMCLHPHHTGFAQLQQAPPRRFCTWYPHATSTNATNLGGSHPQRPHSRCCSDSKCWNQRWNSAGTSGWAMTAVAIICGSLFVAAAIC